MAADKPAKAPPLYEGGGTKSTEGWGHLDEARIWGMVAPMTRPDIRFAFAASLALLSACSGSESPEKAAAANKPTALATPVPTPFTKDEKNDLVEFHYAWSKEAAAEPRLAAVLTADMDKTLADLQTNAAADRDEREKRGFPFNPYTSSTDYETAGQSERLLSLITSHGEYTGGAHPNSLTSTLLWDRGIDKEVKFAELFASPDNRDRLLTQRWCDALNVEREKKRGAPVGGDGIFDECPKLDGIAIAPVDKDGNGRFERLSLIASPYVAGPYVEGSYEIELAVTGDLIAALKDAYKAGFEAVQAPQ